MRSLAVAALLAFTSAPVVAADKDEDRAKEVAAAFLKALKAKNLDAILKTVDVPFLFEDTKEPITRPDNLRVEWEKFLPKVKPEKILTEIEMVMDVPTFAKKAATDKEKRYAEHVEKLIGKTGYLVYFKTKSGTPAFLLVHVKDGKAKVAGFGD